MSRILLKYLFLLWAYMWAPFMQVAAMHNLQRPSGRSSLSFDNFRFGGGAGYGLYITNQMDYAITTNFGSFNELQTNFTVGMFQGINDRFEIGVHYRNGHLLTLKSENTQGTSADFDEVQLQVNYSFNNDVSVNKGWFTINAQAGLGANQFRSMYFLVDPKAAVTKQIISSVGYENAVISNRDEPNKITTVIGNLGIVAGVRLLPFLRIYWENSLNTTVSNKMSGNLFKRSWIPPDSYFYTGLSVYLNFNTMARRDRLGCPKF